MNKEVTKTKNKKAKVKRKISIQKIFNLISFIFILACCFFYGGRLIKLYLEANKTEKIETLASIIIDNNKDSETITNTNGTYYFNGKESNNYITYSNLTWRILRINLDKSITLVLDNSITSLAYGEDNNFKSSHLNYWLNDQEKKHTGVLEGSLNLPSKYLTYTNTCIDTINDTKNITCKESTNDIYITVPSINDYVNSGSSKSFMNNEEYFYLANTNNKNKAWYVDKVGKVLTGDNLDIIGVKPVITIKNTVSLIEGDGTKENPYTFEKENSLFGSYVKLGQDTWRIYQVEEDNIKLSLNSYLKINNKEVTYKYSNSGYYHNDTKDGTLAYYLKNTYLKSLPYKDIINEVNFSNGLYSNANNFNYIKTLETTVPTKVAALSIGDIYLNNQTTNYYTSTGISKDSNLVYVMQKDYKVYTKASETKLKIVPVISIKKDILTKGNGTIESPYEVE